MKRYVHLKNLVEQLHQQIGKKMPRSGKKF